jgi:hypothetical protein
MAAWRYGDQFGRRRRKQIATVAGVSVVAGGVLLFGFTAGLIGAGAFSPMMNLLNAGSSIYRSRKLIHVPTSDGRNLRVRLSELQRTQLYADGDGVLLRISAVRDGPPPNRWQWDARRMEVDLTGDEALRAAGALLPRFNSSGGSRADVSRAVSYLEESTDPKRLFRRAVDTIERREHDRLFNKKSNLLKNLPTAGRLALEMAAHEDSERRALEGELYILEEAWREAEVIAGIADDMFLPTSVDEDLARLKRTVPPRP